MNSHPEKPEPPPIAACSPAERPEALSVLYDGLLLSQKQGLVDAINAAENDDTAWQALFSADQASLPPAAAWLQSLPGQTAVLWPPDFFNPGAPALLAAVTQFADQRQIPLVQFLAAADELPDKQFSEQLLAQHGFRPLATLNYLVAETVSASPAAKPVEDLSFEPYAGNHPQRLAALIEQTYVGTLDCPALDGVRSMESVLTSYRAQGTCLPEQWYFVQHNDQDAGVLLLAAHPAGGNWELVYMALTQEFRGQGFGACVVRHALQQAARAKVERVVLAVDAQNKFALRMYERAGFTHWDERVVYARLHDAT